MTALFRHSKCIIADRGVDGADLIDPRNGHWQNFPTIRAAKWNATVWSRLSVGFGTEFPDDERIERMLQSIHLVESIYRDGVHVA
jgi:hypothetical protein